ncbi:13858_t:CDS:1 [Dentiscutata erythropus]|uniref:13858_t:CDS:1 n=1 Tax=Dentiscutata erythropus TaxID=1348616 RepID=A0A9N8WM28_9GLOM|nr:13858_t:CDS:1 [Dentiscutata erythropus]
MEIIDNELYVYAANISLIDINSVAKKKASNSNNSFTSKIYKSVRSRLLTTHQNANEKSSKETSTKMNKHTIDLTTENSHFSKHARVEDAKKEDDLYKQSAECSKKYVNGNNEYENNVEIIDKNECAVQDQEKRSKGKEKMVQFTVHNTRSRSEMGKNTNEKR